MTKLHKILAGLAVLQLVLAAVVLWPKPAQSAAAPLLGAITLESVTDMTLTDNTGKTYHFQKQGDEWVMADRANYPAAGAAIESLLQNLLKTDTARLVSQTAESHRQLKVADDDYERKIVIKSSDGKEQTLLLGTMSGMAANNVRLLPGNEVYLSRDVSSYAINMTFSSWGDNKLLQADTAKVTGIILVNENGEFDFSRVNASEWKMNNLPAGEEFNNATMTNVLIRAASFSFDDVVGSKDQLKPEYKLDQPQAELTVKIEDENPRTAVISIGAPSDDGQNYYAMVSDQPYIVKVNKALAEHFLAKTMSDFLTQPTPVPSVSPTP